jgi:hypothetical protein
MAEIFTPDGEGFPHNPYAGADGMDDGPFFFTGEGGQGNKNKQETWEPVAWERGPFLRIIAHWEISFP